MPDSTPVAPPASQPGAGTRLPYRTPTLKVYGDLARLTQSLKNLVGADGHPGQGMSKSG